MYHLRLIWLPLTKKFKKSRLNTVFQIFLLQNRKALPHQKITIWRVKTMYLASLIQSPWCSQRQVLLQRDPVTHKQRDKQHCNTQWHDTCAFYIMCVCVYMYTYIHTYRQTGIYLYIFLLVCFTMKSQHPCIFLMVHLRNLLSHSQIFQGCLKQTMRRKLLLKELILNS